MMTRNKERAAAGTADAGRRVEQKSGGRVWPKFLALTHTVIPFSVSWSPKPPQNRHPACGMCLCRCGWNSTKPSREIAGSLCARTRHENGIRGGDARKSDKLLLLVRLGCEGPGWVSRPQFTLFFFFFPWFQNSKFEEVDPREGI